jgi:NitT/TauT family transport system ATP-binding protein
MDEPVIELNGVAKLFDARGVIAKALDEVDLVVRPQRFVALVGPSGCGKSTVLNLVAGLLDPSAGSVRYRGNSVERPNRRVGYMTQKDTLLPWRSVADNIGLPLELACRALNRAERHDRVEQMMELVGLAGFGRHYPSELSGGMRRRAALARMLIYEPETLLLDEPFGALDAQLKLVMQQELARLTHLRQMTVLFVTHDLTEAIALADEVAVFTRRPGRIRRLCKIGLPQPRDIVSVRFTPEFAGYHDLLWNELKEEFGTGGDA